MTRQQHPPAVHERRGAGIPFGVALLATVASLMLGIAAPAAFGGHWHSFNNRTHGLEHGSSTTDGYFFGRTYGYYVGDTNYCGVGDTTVGVNYNLTSINADLCSAWTGHFYVAIDECRGASFNASVPNVPLSGHNHYAHNYGGSCRVVWS